MGEIADMMLDGTLCQGCGVYIGLDGYPGYCSGCSKDMPNDEPIARVGKNKPKFSEAPKVACPCCSKMIKVTGIGMHWQQVHAQVQS